jgi:TolB-like protein/DNA-binding SARP family transcriptional activator/Tfp pilus assembly protein PilF
VLVLKQLGNASLTRSGTPVNGRAAQGRRLALLAILASARGRPTTRDKIIALLWPESSTARARHQLSDTLYILRAGLGDDVILASGDELTLNADTVISDVVQFDRLIDDDDLEQAVEIYDGPLLDGFHLGDAPEFERWLDAERTRISQRYAAALEALASRSEGDGDFTTAVKRWRRLAAHDPFSGRIALGLMRALEAAGDRAGALKHARVHAELLVQEFETEPDTDVVAFAERLRLSPPSRPAPEPAPPARAVATIQAVEKVQEEVEPLQPASGNAAGTTGQRSRRQRTRVYSALAAALAALMIVVGTVYARSALRPRTRTTEHALAVLPFVNMSADGGSDYFSDGLSEQIISVLSRIPGLRVAARTSSFAMRDAKLDIRAIAATLNVDAVLEGSVRKNGSRLRVTAQLIDATTGYHIWSSDYDREMLEILAVQDEIARDIARALELRIPVRAAESDSRRLPDLQAYDLYLRALYLRDTFTPDALRQAREYLDRAIELDPTFAGAYALKATVLGPAMYFRYVPLQGNVEEARTAIERALELDPRLGEAFGALGMLKLFFDWDFDGAQRAMLRAVELNPSDHHAWHMLGNYYRATGRPEDAVTARAHAVAVDPLNARMGLMLAADYTVAGRFQEALAQYSRSLKLDPAHPLALGLGPNLPAGPSWVYLQQGRDAEVVDEYVRIATMRGASPSELEALRSAYQSAGMASFWRSWLSFDLRHAGSDPDPVRVATFHALAGDPLQAVEWLERAHAERNPALIFVYADPTFAALRDHPRFRRILQQMNFPIGSAERGSARLVGPTR